MVKTGLGYWPRGLAPEPPPDHRLDVSRPRLGEPLRRLELRLVLWPPLGGHVGAEVGRGHQRARGAVPPPIADLRYLSQEAGRAARVHHVDHFALEVGVTLVEHRRAEPARVMGDVGQLAAGTSTRESELVHQVELSGP